MVNYENSVERITKFYTILWIVLLWLPYIHYYNIRGSIKPLFNQLTWWCWTLQAFFYTFVYIKETTCFTNLTRKYPLTCCCMSIFCTKYIYIYSIVSGTVWFVFLFFSYILFNNPTMIHEETMNSTNDGGVIQVANIMMHYYIVAGISIWTVSKFDELRIGVKNTIRNKTYRKILFDTIWILFVFCYLIYWKFDIQGIFLNYHIEDIDNVYNVIALVSSALFACTANAVYLHSILH